MPINKTRIAPTPSGYLHLGNVLSFALTAAIAEKANASILLRIDDMDRGRMNPLYVQDVFDTLNFLEIPWHEGPRNLQEFESEWSQLHRVGMYQKALNDLQHSGHVFACHCSRAQIRSHNADEPYPGTCCKSNIPLTTAHTSWRLYTDTTTPLMVNTWPQGTIHNTLPATMQNFVVRKKDGYPAYQLSSVLDDVYFGINLIVRGQDLWPSTLAQHYLANVLGAEGFKQSRFCHHALLTGPDGLKLSKSAGATSVRYLRGQGKKPADVYAMIAVMLGVTEQVKNWQQLAMHMSIV